MADIDTSRLAYFSGRHGLELRASDISPSAEGSFWSFVDLNWTRECWIWLGQTEGQYGRFKIGKRRAQAHRLAYALAWGHR